MTSIAESLSVDDDPDLEHYLVRTRIDIISVLRTLTERQIQVRVKFSRRPDPVYTKLLSIKPEYEELVFDVAGIPYLDSLDGSESLTAESRYDSIRVLFTAGHVEAASYRGQPAFRARIPKAIARIQRRSSVRCPVPALNPPVVSVRMSPDDKFDLHLRVMDISLSGVALIAEDPDVSFKTGMTLANCRIDLPGCGAVETDLELTHVSKMDGGRGWHRLGARFAGLTVLALTHVRRYVSGLERNLHPAK